MGLFGYMTLASIFLLGCGFVALRLAAPRGNGAGLDSSELVDAEFDALTNNNAISPYTGLPMGSRHIDIMGNPVS